MSLKNDEEWHAGMKNDRRARSREGWRDRRAWGCRTEQIEERHMVAGERKDQVIVVYVGKAG
jgi:hypothetical protein